MEKLLTVEEVAKTLGYAPKTLYRLLSQRKIGLKTVQQGRKISVRPEELDRYVKSLEVSRVTDNSANHKGRKKRPRRLTETETQAFFDSCDAEVEDEAGKIY